ncbi:hypothetical protein ILUMI_18496 [Ignelater luminosus]|uniref:Large ribosomal subunit protein uL3m n=1 Tax=Ignelater luminosus TaxID=2038154 RepID=A0A8K0CP25_IGNLU|nr:hypothetical protein ILUMI_18496 [Ignelater luminosus]
MALISHIIRNTSIKSLEEKFLCLSLQSLNNTQIREKQVAPQPRLRNPTWLTKKNRVIHDDFVTQENREFISEIVQDKYENNTNKNTLPNTVEWTPNMRRTGVIAKKIGVLDNHVIRYYTPEEYKSPRERAIKVKNKAPCIIMGAEAVNPTLFTKEYCGLFKDSGVMPKKYLARFFVSSEAALPLGTPVSALHYSVGNYVDVCLHRMVLQKTHRRGGNIGGGGEKGRVWPGTKMPGHMGNRYRITKGLKIWRINTKYNVLWVSGCAVPGETNSIVYIYDTILPLRKPTKPLPFPTYFDINNQDVPEDIYDDSVHKFDDLTLTFE